jgi:hypothetical protein
MATATEFRSELRRRFREDTAVGRAVIDVVARDLHDVVQRINPTRTQRYPNCCSVMRQEQRLGDVVISERASDGPNFAIRYRLPRPS